MNLLKTKRKELLYERKDYHNPFSDNDGGFFFYQVKRINVSEGSY